MASRFWMIGHFLTLQWNWHFRKKTKLFQTNLSCSILQHPTDHFALSYGVTCNFFSVHIHSLFCWSMNAKSLPVCAQDAPVDILQVRSRSRLSCARRICRSTCRTAWGRDPAPSWGSSCSCRRRRDASPVHPADSRTESHWSGSAGPGFRGSAPELKKATLNQITNCFSPLIVSKPILTKTKFSLLIAVSREKTTSCWKLRDFLFPSPTEVRTDHSVRAFSLNKTSGLSCHPPPSCFEMASWPRYTESRLRTPWVRCCCVWYFRPLLDKMSREVNIHQALWADEQSLTWSWPTYCTGVHHFWWKGHLPLCWSTTMLEPSAWGTYERPVSVSVRAKARLAGAFVGAGVVVVVVVAAAAAKTVFKRKKGCLQVQRKTEQREILVFNL